MGDAMHTEYREGPDWVVLAMLAFGMVVKFMGV